MLAHAMQALHLGCYLQVNCCSHEVALPASNLPNACDVHKCLLSNGVSMQHAVCILDKLFLANLGTTKTATSIVRHWHGMHRQ
jgi:hypothetical protein